MAVPNFLKTSWDQNQTCCEDVVLLALQSMKFLLLIRQGCWLQQKYRGKQMHQLIYKNKAKSVQDLSQCKHRLLISVCKLLSCFSTYCEMSGMRLLKYPCRVLLETACWCPRYICNWNSIYYPETYSLLISFSKPLQDWPLEKREQDSMYILIGTQVRVEEVSRKVYALTHGHSCYT